jgi:hypothetical protein
MKGATHQRAESSFSDFAGGLPHNIEAEQGLLGAILINNEAYSLVSRLIETGDFFEPIHREIYRVAGDLISVGKLATPVTLKSYLPADLDVAGMSLDRYLARLCAEATTVINAADYAKIDSDDPAPYWKIARGELGAIRRRQWLMPPEQVTSRTRQGIHKVCDEIG